MRSTPVEPREREQLNKEQRKYIRAALRDLRARPDIHACYRTAQLLAMIDSQHGRVKYQEGFALSIAPVQHAWNTIDGKLFDLTFDLLEKRGHSCADVQYFGIAVPTDEVKRVVCKLASYGSVLEEICRERKSSVHIVSFHRFSPVANEVSCATAWAHGTLISDFDEFLQAVAEWKSGNGSSSPL